MLISISQSARAGGASAARHQGEGRSVLQKLSPLFDDLYAKDGRPSISPEQLLKSRVLMALYSVCSERSYCEQLAYNLLWLWFLDRELDEGSFDPTVFTHNSERVLSAEAAKGFFVQIYQLSRQEGWTSSEHFTADGIDRTQSLAYFVAGTYNLLRMARLGSVSPT